MNCFLLNHGAKQEKKKQISRHCHRQKPSCQNLNTIITLYPQVFPRFIIIETVEENTSITSLSPFVIQKVIQSIAGEPKSIKKLTRSNQLLVEVTRKAHAENLLRTQTFHNLKVRVHPHSSLNSSRGVIRCPDLRGCSEQEILDEMKSQGGTAVKRFRIKKDGQLKDTNTFVFTISTPVLPPMIKNCIPSS